MKRLWRGFSRWGTREETGWTRPIDVALLGLIVVAFVTGSIQVYATIIAFSLLAILERAWRLGA